MFCRSPADSNRHSSFLLARRALQPAARQAATRPHPGPLDLRRRHTFRGPWNGMCDLMGWMVFCSASMMAKPSQPSRIEMRDMDTRDDIRGRTREGEGGAQSLIVQCLFCRRSYSSNVVFPPSLSLSLSPPSYPPVSMLLLARFNMDISNHPVVRRLRWSCV
ncbi:uncharacterized protein LY79DRAFT_566403 [Colletotrichum navitas]|uniref:Uncharacterized protein n=1 Tax=Colletotrichum navitas TaxID=681940 RepID=A0AAD8UYU5_9PEZI|nr:uncharacterized protein LY79DRAFT_566403 [Colletotrichum navitas]KAK1574226.1 hypothetical protein LY79DRAFT_566403 [Colletotrichum navitas]